MQFLNVRETLRKRSLTSPVSGFRSHFLAEIPCRHPYRDSPVIKYNDLLGMYACTFLSESCDMKSMVMSAISDTTPIQFVKAEWVSQWEAIPTPAKYSLIVN